MAEFVHLHCHTYYSLLDGLSSPQALVQRAVELGMPALAITDHGALYGVVEFYKAATKAGIKPIIGIEAYLAQRGMEDRSTTQDRRHHHLLLLAQNQTGYQNLLRLASLAMLKGFYYKPRVDKETLAAHSDGLIATSGCGSSEIPRLLKDGRMEEARQAIDWYRQVFEGRFFLELQSHDIPELDQVNRHLITLARELDLPLVATNDVHYARREQARAHDVLLAIGTGKSLHDPNRLRMDGETYYMRSEQEMAALFAEAPQALTNTLRVAEMCQVEIAFGTYRLPPFAVPEGETAASYLRRLCEEGIRQRYGERADSPEVKERLEHELNIIHEMGFDTYFLIVWDLCRAAQERGIWYNARGSAAGSIVAYSLGITMVDPLANGLIFERFLNPGRVTMPDIDLDFPDDSRAEMIEYTLQKYGRENVAQIITFGTLGARAAVRDVGRVMDIPLNEVDRIAKMIPSVPGKPVSIREALEQVSELQALYETTPYVQELLDTAVQLEGVARHASTHAAGVVIADAPLVEYCPLNRPTKGESGEGELLTAVTQWSMENLDDIGLLKIDFLGLSTLTVMRRACELIHKRHGISLDLDTIPLDDPAIYQLISSGNVAGVFQVEGSGFRRVLRDMRPSRYEHIVAALALYRPGPMEHIPNYISRMHGEEEIVYRHPALAPILDETFGIIVFQEQIIQLATQLAGYEPGEADTIRKAVGKKKKKDLLAHRAKFIQGAVENGIPRATAEAIFDDIEYFARYGFNKCLPGDVEIVDGATGRLVTIEDLYREHARAGTTVTCDISALRLAERPIRSVVDNGIKPVYRLTTALGHTIEATANHPFYTSDGWLPLAELKEGDRIGVPRRIPVEGGDEWPEHEVIALGHLLAEGNLDHPHSVYFYSRNEELVKEYVRAAERFPNTRCTISKHQGVYSVYARRADRSEPPGIVTWAQRLGIWGKRATEKEIPAAVFELTNQQIALLIARMWEGDGYTASKGRGLLYTTSSYRMALQLQHLLLRLGIVSLLQQAEFPYRDTGYPGYQLFVTGNDIETFARLVAPRMVREANREAIEAMLLEAAYFDDPAIYRDAESDIYWDRIVSIEYAGEKRTYDLEIEGTHNFVANDILVHNSHAADYAVLTCQTAYLKAHYPVEYMTALLTVERNNTEKVGVLVSECRRMGIEVLPPSINHSDLPFTIEDGPEGACIRFGLGAVKNVGDGPVEVIARARDGRPFEDLEDFCRRVDLRQVNRRAMESLIKVGAFAGFGQRARLLAGLDRLFALSNRIHRAREVGQMSLFGEATGVRLDADANLLGDLPPIEAPREEIGEWEKELAGTYLSEHPLVETIQMLADVVSTNTAQLPEEQPGQTVTIAGLVRRARRHTTQNGKEMGFVTLEDLYGVCDVVVFPRTWGQTREVWVPDRLVIVCGEVNLRNDRISLICKWVKTPEEMVRPRTASPPPPTKRRLVQVTIRRSGDTQRDLELLTAVHELLLSFPGDDRFAFLLTNGPGGTKLLEFPNHSTGYCRSLGEKLTDMLGPGSVEVQEVQW